MGEHDYTNTCDVCGADFATTRVHPDPPLDSVCRGCRQERAAGAGASRDARMQANIARLTAEVERLKMGIVALTGSLGRIGEAAEDSTHGELIRAIDAEAERLDRFAAGIESEMNPTPPPPTDTPAGQKGT